MFDSKNKQHLKRFGIISAIIFSAIAILSGGLIQSCGTNTILCSNLFLQSVRIIILVAGLIGLGYCLIILKSFDVKLDHQTAKEYNKIVEDLESSEDKTNMTYDNNKTENNSNKKIDLFF